MSEANSSSIRRFVRCIDQGVAYALDMTRVRDVQLIESLNPDVSGGAGLGSILLQGRSVPVYSLRGLLHGASEGVPSEGKIVILEDEGSVLWAVLVDAVQGMFSVSDSAIHPIPAIIGAKAAARFESVLRFGEQPILCLSSLDPWKRRSEPGPAGVPAPASELPALDSPQAGKSRGRLLLFSILAAATESSRILFGLSIRQVSDIQRPALYTRVPGAPDFLLGLACWRDTIIPIVDLARWLSLDASSSTERLIVAECPSRGGFLGFLSSADIQVRSLPLPHRPSTSLSGLISTEGILGVFEQRDEYLFLPDPELIWQGSPS